MRTLFTTFIIIAMCGFTVSAQTATAPSAGDGSSGNPYQIATLENLSWITQNSSTWGSYFIQTANINASATSGWSGGAGMPTIGTGYPNYQYFTGSYDGQGYTIYGLTMNRASDNAGMFGFLNGTGIVKNLGLINVSIAGQNYVGGIAGANAGTINNCFVTGNVTGNRNDSRYIGGLVGENYTNIDSCYSSAAVLGFEYIGGLAGASGNSAYHIANSFATGQVNSNANGYSKIGGLVGAVTNSGNIVNCYATGFIYGAFNTGGLVGYSDGSAVNISNSFWDTQTTGRSTSTGGGTGKTTTEMKTSTTFTSAGWSLTAPWGMNASVNGGYPYLRSASAPPRILSMTPSMNARNISASSNITMVFSKPMNSSTLSAGTSVTVIGSLSGRHSGSISYNTATYTATFDPTADFFPGEVVTVIVTAQAASTVGVPMASPAVWQGSVQSVSSDSLGSLVNVATVSTPIAPVAADLDNDGDIDIVTADHISNSIAVMLNSGNRTFAAPVVYSLSASVRSIAVADIDNDGDLDVIAAVNNTCVSILKNNGNGTFAAAVNYTVGQFPTIVAVSDIDGDGDLDIAAANFSSSTISVIFNNGSGVFGASTDYSGLSSCHGVQFADVDGDKDMDLIAAGYYSAGVGVFLNNGNGTFGAMTAYAAGSNPVEVRLADLDGDGDEDMAVVNSGSNSVSVLMNNGNGTFAAKVDYTVPAVPNNVTPADIDGDGDIDLVVPSVDGSAVSVLRNNGSGQFTVQQFPMGFKVSGSAVADMDGDGKLDVILVSHTDNLVKVLFAGAPTGKALSFNGTDGYAKVAVPTPTAYTIEMWVKPADVTSRIIGSFSDGTGPATSYNTHQIGITSDHKFQHYLFDGSLHFVTGTTTVVANRWYHVAITATNNGQMRLFVNGVEEGTPVSIGTMFTSVNTYFFGMSSPQGSAYTGVMDNMRIWNYARTGAQIAAGMFTDYSGAQSGLLRNYRCNEMTGTFAADSSGNAVPLTLGGSGYAWSVSNYPPQPSVSAISPAANANSLTRSGNITATFSVAMDATSFVSGTSVKVTGSQSGNHAGTIALSNGGTTMTFDPAADFAAGEYVDVVLTTGITSADVIPLPAKRSWRFLVGSVAADSFAAAIQYGSGLPSPYSLGMADIDGDGDNDIVAVNYGGSTLSVMKNNGAGMFPDRTDYSVGVYPTSVFLADVDGDGDKDILYTRYTSNVVGVMKNDGNGSFGTATEYACSTTTFTVTAADVDGDGDLDIIAGNFGTNTISVLKNNGNGTFAARTDYSAGAMAQVVPVDMDGDGDIDIVTNDRYFGVIVCLNNGQGAFPTNTSYNYTGGSGLVEWVDAGDIDGDGDADVVTVDRGLNTVTVIRNNGNATFSSHVSYNVGSSPSSVRFMDVDGDGDLDLVVTNAVGNSITILKNSGDGTFGQRSDYPVGAAPYSLQVSDVNNDGRVDILTANLNAGNVSVLLNSTFAALPVELTSFTAIPRGSAIELHWSTATEVNNHGFEVERKAIDNEQLSMNNWSKAGFVEGNGASNTPQDYIFIDKNITAGRYSYRLKQIDRDGKFEYSKTVEVTIASAPAKFVLEQNFPNPFNPSTTIGFSLQVSGLTTLKIYDAIGREVATLANENLEAGVYHQRTFDASHLASGFYLARLTNGNSTQIKKLTLIK